MHSMVVAWLLVVSFAGSLPAGSKDPAATKQARDPAATTISHVPPGSLAPGDQAVPAASEGSGLVFLVRHAERADAGMAAAKMAGADPELSDAGKARAQALAALLRDARISTIFTTQYKRTKDTAQPLAAASGAKVTVIDATDGSGLIARVKGASGNVLVVGHSNTLPDLINALGIAEPVTIADDQFDDLFLVVRGPKPTLLRLHYR
jgi:phosphohistidine phosphatase SixA